jgi:hypothetical protein
MHRDLVGRAVVRTPHRVRVDNVVRSLACPRISCALERSIYPPMVNASARRLGSTCGARIGVLKTGAVRDVIEIAG